MGSGSSFFGLRTHPELSNARWPCVSLFLVPSAPAFPSIPRLGWALGWCLRVSLVELRSSRCELVLHSHSAFRRTRGPLALLTCFVVGLISIKHNFLLVIFFRQQHLEVMTLA